MIYKAAAGQDPALVKKANAAFNLGFATQLATQPGVTAESLPKRVKTAAKVLTDTLQRREGLYDALIKSAMVTNPAPAAPAK